MPATLTHNRRSYALRSEPARSNPACSEPAAITAPVPLSIPNRRAAYRQRIRDMAGTLRTHCRFPSDYTHSSEGKYERYRADALNALQRHHGLSLARAARIVDDAIAQYERWAGRISNAPTPRPR